jgi:site-specific DNA-methyltransferase (cytosine-N4-specific)
MKSKIQKTDDDQESLGAAQGVGVDVSSQSKMATEHLRFLQTAGLDLGANTEAWSVRGTNTQINYSTHGIYRYFGKFPAPIASKLISDYTKVGDVVVDPACGSGTTGVEALLLNRDALLYDVNPLSTLISRVKTTPMSEEELLGSLKEASNRFRRSRRTEIELPEIDLHHWFLPETIRQLSRIRHSIEREEDARFKEYLLLSFASIVRRVSRATTQQGRLFLDVSTAIEDVWPFFERAATRAAERIGALPKKGAVRVERRSVLDLSREIRPVGPLVIYHPPYFNAYKYTSVNSLEMAWLSHSRKDTRRNEIREFFKVGKPENAEVYVEDVVRSLQVIRQYLKKDGVAAMMIGDTRLKGEYVRVTAPIISRVSSYFGLEKIILRIPRYTEASWASSQRRKSVDLGITIYDFIVLFRAV